MSAAPTQRDYARKFQRIAPHTDYRFLPAADRQLIARVAGEWQLTQQELRQVSAMALERVRWKEAPLSEALAQWREHHGGGGKKRALAALREMHETLRAAP
ncbi:MAG: hypothetical protein OXU22_09755, partial [Gammaproteobacteria bacterium]|nr:hypothetical protein [Gammaproteobacteria bacterium]